MNSIHMQIYIYTLYIHNIYTKRYRDIGSHTDRELDKSLHRKDMLFEVSIHEPDIVLLGTSTRTSHVRFFTVKVSRENSLLVCL